MIFADRRALLGLSVLALCVSGLLLFGPKQAFTGDEPRYLVYALSFWRTGGFSMSLPEWQQLYVSIAHNPSEPLPQGVDGAPFHGIYLPVLLSPVAAAFSLSGLRLVTLAAGLVGLAFLYRLCGRVSASGGALLAVAVAALTVPLLPYLHLFYMEAFLFALICVGWERLQDSGRRPGEDTATALLILAIPFVHMRGSVVAALLYAFFLWRIYRCGHVRRTALLAGLGAAAVGVLVALNLAIYGAVAGPINLAAPPWPPSAWFPIAAMQLFNVRHGLLAYAPVWLLGYAGLVVGTIRGSRVASQALALAFVVAVTAMGPNPGECWPARFWVQSVPMLAVGFALWWEVGRLPLLRAIGIVLIAFTLINTALFAVDPNAFLANRQTAVTYQTLFDRFGYFDFGLILPVEVDDALDRDAVRNFAVGAGAFILSVALAAMRRRSLYALPAVLLLAALVDLTRVRLVPAASYTVTTEPDRLALSLQTPMNAGYLQLGRDWEMWYVSPARPKFTVETSSSDRPPVVQAANQVVPLESPNKFDAVAIESTAGFDLRSEAGERLRVYRSASLLRRWFPYLSSRS